MTGGFAPRCRQVVGLLSVEEAPNPWPKAKLTGLPAIGKAFEKKVAKALPQAAAGRWFRYVDQNGPGFCSPDLVLVHQGVPFVLECKLTYTPEASAQLQGLYIPILEKFLSRPVYGIIVLKSLGRGFSGHRLVQTMEEALATSLAGGTPALLAPMLTPAHTRRQFQLPH